MKTNTTLAIIFLVLFCIAIFPFIRSILPTDTQGKNSVAFPLLTITEKNTQKITIVKEDARVTLVKDNAIWKVDTLPVSKTAIDAFFIAVADSKIGTVVSKNKESHTEYGVASQSAIQITATGANGDQSFLFGYPAQETGSVYARPAASDWVYSVQTSVPSVVFTTADQWQEKTITSFDSHQIVSVDLQGGLPPVNLQKKDNATWELGLSGTKRTLKDSTVQPVLNQLAHLEARGFIKDEELSMSTVAQDLVMKDKDGLILASLILKKVGEQYHVQKKDDQWWFLLSNTSINALINLATAED